MLDLSALPEDVRWFYETYQKHPASWVKEESGDVIFYQKQLTKDSDHWQKMMTIFDTFSIGKELIVQDAYGIYNPSLVGAFITQLQIMHNRMESDPDIFRRRAHGTNEYRKWVLSKFEARVSQCPWNDGTKPAILPTIHGTSFSIALKICATGFANLSSLDDGFFGKGIYFTTYALYALPYFSSKDQPAILLSFVLPGNTYPVNENSKSKKSLVGTALVSGCNSHYVITTSQGEPPDEPRESDIYDELVIPQEAQISPFLLLRIDSRNLNQLRARMADRDIPRAREDDNVISLTETLL